MLPRRDDDHMHSRKSYIENLYVGTFPPAGCGRGCWRVTTGVYTETAVPEFQTSHRGSNRGRELGGCGWLEKVLARKGFLEREGETMESQRGEEPRPAPYSMATSSAACSHGCRREAALECLVYPGWTPFLLTLLEDGNLVCANPWHRESSMDVSKTTCLKASDLVSFCLRFLFLPWPPVRFNSQHAVYPQRHLSLGTALSFSSVNTLHACSVPVLTLLHKLLPSSPWDRHLRRQMGLQQMKDIPIHNSSSAS